MVPRHGSRHQRPSRNGKSTSSNTRHTHREHRGHTYLRPAFRTGHGGHQAGRSQRDRLERRSQGECSGLRDLPRRQGEPDAPHTRVSYEDGGNSLLRAQAAGRGEHGRDCSNQRQGERDIRDRTRSGEAQADFRTVAVRDRRIERREDLSLSQEQGGRQPRERSKQGSDRVRDHREPDGRGRTGSRQQAGRRPDRSSSYEEDHQAREVRHLSRRSERDRGAIARHSAVEPRDRESQEPDQVLGGEERRPSLAASSGHVHQERAVRSQVLRRGGGTLRSQARHRGSRAGSGDIREEVREVR